MTLDELEEAVNYHLPRDPNAEPRDLDLNVAVWALEQLRILLDELAIYEDARDQIASAYAHATKDGK
jgi:hypothetical protein